MKKYLIAFVAITLMLSCDSTAQKLPPHQEAAQKPIQDLLKAPDPMPVVSAGKVMRLPRFPSTITEPRNVDIWLPEGYSKDQHYPVLYMHDGQMLFDTTHTWNHQEWGVDETATQMIQKGSVQPFIVVGIWNAVVNRHIDYFPQKPFESMTQAQQDTVYKATRSGGQNVFSGKVRSDAYLSFIVKELKPYIDKNFSTLSDREHTFVAGSSMGGLISMYALCEYPDVFGGAACLSTHWPGIFRLDNNPVPDAFMAYMEAHLPDPATHKLYFDYGDKTLDAMYPALQKKADKILKKKGYKGKHRMTRFFPGEDHSERAWRERLSVPLEFLMR